jgi:non-specific serine/threonine protein kinase
MNPVQLVPVLTPHGRLLLAQDVDDLALDAEVAERLQASFARGAGHGLLQLGAGEAGTALPAAFSYWRELAARYVTALCGGPGSLYSEDLSPGTPELAALVCVKDFRLFIRGKGFFECFDAEVGFHGD